MEKRFISSVLFLAIVLSGFAQVRHVTLSGSVVEKDNNAPVEQATVQLLLLPDSIFASGTASNRDGRFSLTAKPGNYVLKISSIGYTTLFKAVSLSASVNPIRLGNLSLEPDNILLDEAIIVAEAPPVTMKKDTTVYSASAFRTPEGAMLEELVKKLPGAQVDDDGNITINGKEVKRIMVDGKEFFSDDPKVSMKNLPANIIDKVKAYDKKSDAARITGIEDGEEETVLDLAVKKGMKQGWIGNLIAGYGTKNRYEAGAMLNRFRDQSSITLVGSANNTNGTGFSEFGNTGQGMNSGGSGSGITASKSVGMNFNYDHNKLRINGSAQYGYSDNDASRKNSTESFIGQITPFSRSENSSVRKRHDMRTNFMLEWNPDTLSTLIFRPFFRYSIADTESENSSENSNNDRLPVNSSLSRSSNSNHSYSVNGRLQYFRKLNSKGRNLFVGFNFGLTDSQGESASYSTIRFYTYDENGTLVKDSINDLRTDQRNDNFNYELSASYTEPLFKNHYLQLRYEFNHRKSNSESLVYAQNHLGGTPQGYHYTDSLSNGADNYYDSHNVELSLRGVTTKMMYSAGVSMTPQRSESDRYAGPGSNRPSLKQHVLNFAPSVMFRYLFTPQHLLMFRYNGQSREPDIESLQEVIDITDPLNLRYGNPGLKPSFSHNFVLFYNKFVPDAMRSFSANLFFTGTTNSIVNRVVYDPADGVRRSYKENVNGNWNVRSYFSFNTPLRNKKFTVSSNTSLSYNHGISFANAGNESDKQLSTTHNFSAGEKLTGSYRTETFDISLNASVDYNLIRNGTQEKNNRQNTDYTFGGNSNVNLPWGLAFSTDIGYRIKSGYSGGFDKNEVLWNAQLSKSLFKNKATIRVKMYDILQQQNNLMRSISDTSISDTEYNTLGSYVMVHFVYRLNTLGGKAPGRERTARSMRRTGVQRVRGGGPGI